MVLWELVGNIPSASTVSSVAGGSVNKFLGLGVGLGEVSVKLFWGRGVISGSRSLWARHLDKACWLTGYGEMLVGNVSWLDSWTFSMAPT